MSFAADDELGIVHACTTFRCCSDVSYFPWLGYDASLAFNSTTWYGYALGFGVWKYDVQVALSQGSFFPPPHTHHRTRARTRGVDW